MHNVTGFPLPPAQETQLRSTNEKIAKLAAAKPAGDIHSAFIVVAQLATEAVGGATQLDKIPGIDPGQMQSVIDCWYRLADLARTAAPRCAVWAAIKPSPRPLSLSCFSKRPARGSRLGRKQPFQMDRERW
jgi:hypothetical protein